MKAIDDLNRCQSLVIRESGQLSAASPGTRWLEARLNTPGRVGLPWPSLLAFLRIITNPHLFEMPLSMAQAWGQVQEWLALPTVWTPGPTERHAAILSQLLQSTSVMANLVADAHLAALSIEHGLILCSSDSDFARFPGLCWENPLLDAPEAEWVFRGR